MLKTLLAFLPVRCFCALGCGFAGPCHRPIGNLDLMPGDFWWDSGVLGIRVDKNKCTTNGVDYGEQNL